MTPIVLEGYCDTCRLSGVCNDGKLITEELANDIAKNGNAHEKITFVMLIAEKGRDIVDPVWIQKQEKIPLDPGRNYRLN